MPVAARSVSFASQRDDRIHPRRASRGDVAGEEGHQRERARDGGDRRRVAVAHAEEEGRQQLREAEHARDPDQE